MFYDRGHEMQHAIARRDRPRSSQDMAFAAHGGDYCCNGGGSCKQCSLEFSFAIFMLGRNGMPGASQGTAPHRQPLLALGDSS